MSRQPALFIGHGSPMNALESNRFTDQWREIGATITPPRAVVVVSAHWYINATAVTAMDRPRTIHDFYGFPDELFAFDYPCPGSPEIAREIVETLAPVWVGLDADSWGIDHGTWSVLTHLVPRADVPVIQLSIDATKSYIDHLAIGRALAPLRDRDVLVIGSGNVVHNLRTIDWSLSTGGFDWADDFDSAVRELMTTRPHDLPSVGEHPAFSRAVPTDDHFAPLLYVAGIAAADSSPVHSFNDARVMGSLSMTSYVVA